MVGGRLLCGAGKPLPPSFLESWPFATVVTLNPKPETRNDIVENYTMSPEMQSYFPEFLETLKKDRTTQ